MRARRFLLLACVLAFAGIVQTDAIAARLHYPLPPDSTARNGERGPLGHHLNGFNKPAPPAVLTRKGMHPKAALGLHRLYSGTPVDVLNYHNDNFRTGWNQSETDLTPATVGSASFGQIASLDVDGDVMAEPLMVSNFTMPDSTVHNILVVATENNSVYAFDAQTYAILWHVNLGTPQSYIDVNCTDVQPVYGISGTPVIVRNGNVATIYLVSATEPASMSFHTKLYALNLATGASVVRPMEIAPRANLQSGGQVHFDPQSQWIRAGLAYANGSVYMGVASHCDNNPGSITGWVLRYDASTLRLLSRFATVSTQADLQLASIWMAGFAPPIDANGNIFAVTGNGYYSAVNTAKGYGESVLSLSSILKKNSTFTPANFQALNDADRDFGSGAVMLIPPVAGQLAPPLAVAMGKAHILYLLNASNLGGLEKAGKTPLQQYTVGTSWCACGPAYYMGPNGGLLYYQAASDVIHAFSVSTARHPSLTDVADGTTTAGGGGSFPVVSSNGSTPGTGVVWLVRREMPEILEAYDAVNLGAPLFAGDAHLWSNGYDAFITPLVANGRVYVGSYKKVDVFGLTD